MKANQLYRWHILCIVQKSRYEVHKIFFETVLLRCNAIGQHGLKIVTDREAAIKKAIKIVLPDITLFYCWNHLQRDVGFWLKKKLNSEKSDEIIYKNNIWNLLEVKVKQNSVRNFMKCLLYGVRNF